MQLWMQARMAFDGHMAMRGKLQGHLQTALQVSLNHPINKNGGVLFRMSGGVLLVVVWGSRMFRFSGLRFLLP